MATQRTHYDPFAWWLAREQIGQGVRERYPVLQELPPPLAKLVRKLDAIECKKSSSGWLKQLDAIEGNQLVRACKKRLGPRT